MVKNVFLRASKGRVIRGTSSVSRQDGIIVGLGKAGNPDVMEGVTPGMIFGAGTEAIAGEGLIVTAGAIDCHVHFTCPQLIREAIAAGITTMIGGGTVSEVFRIRGSLRS